MGQSILRWITLPPVVSIATISFVRFMSLSESGPSVHPAIWALVWMMFILLSILYGLFIHHHFEAGLTGVQFLAQGIILCPLALSYGATMFEWVGVIMAASGAIALMTTYHQGQMRYVHAAIRDREQAESSIPVPFLVTGDDGIIVNVSSMMLDLLGVKRDDLVGQNVGGFLAPGDHEVDIGEKTWLVDQKIIDGDKYYFQLSEKPVEVVHVETPITYDESITFTDPVTQLQTMPYAMSRLEEELYRTKRYGYPLTGALMRLMFPESAEADGSARNAFNAVCNAIRDNIRLSDFATNTNDYDILLIFPDCSKSTADTILIRLLGLVNSLRSAHAVLYDTTTLNVFLAFEHMDSVPTPTELIDQLKSAISSKYLLN